MKKIKVVLYCKREEFSTEFYVRPHVGENILYGGTYYKIESIVHRINEDILEIRLKDEEKNK